MRENWMMKCVKFVATSVKSPVYCVNKFKTLSHPVLSYFTQYVFVSH